jgi:hypothetical protein
MPFNKDIGSTITYQAAKPDNWQFVAPKNR